MTLAEIADHLFKVDGERFCAERDLAILRSLQHHVQKKTARQRAGSAGRGR
ncbi:hypothetical protein ABIB82_007563 [Bradyrhizobium sp. i1.8.4]|uniref:hypothetical protein n=1 Tax=unclassified Bradyrhizobium TaxID=2631580 RepID=UPI003D20167A